MRYEDASHTGAFQGSQPVANDDLDSVPAGSKTPATGNLITGEGTQTGSAGADMVAGAHVAAIAGKGGEDSSFSGGKLSVAGEFGRLSVDADGNYVYQADKGVENVRDRFTYTLADNNGATDTASLIVEIGKTPVVIKANAQQIVPGPDGVVTLPPGVELSDIRVVGRNLVIDMPDGTQLIIVDGAIFVPQLQLGGVEVPSTNLAALLIGQEPQPAAGENTQSSGGNFASPVPPLDPGVPLGDLIPPTEYPYQPPEPEELFPDVNDEQPAIVIQPDGQPASVNAVDSVDEDGLPGRDGDLLDEPEGSDEGADGNPSNNSDPDESTAGTIIIDSPDGVDNVTINGVLVTGVIGQVIAGEFGNLTITGFNGQNILYSYTLTDNTSGDNTHDDFSVVLTDNDGDQATATLTIDIIDDVPTARDDTDAVIKGDTSTDGNVMTGVGTTSSPAGIDTVGADNAEVTGVHAGTSGSFTAVPDGGVTIVGQFGDLTLFPDGSYTYTLHAEVGNGGNDVFTYQLTDGDGDTDPATLTIVAPPDLKPVVGPNPTVLLDDDALENGNPGGTGDDPDADNVSGQLSGSGGDAPLTFEVLLTGAPAGFTYESGGDGIVLIKQGANTVVTVTVNADGSYSVVQNNPIVHADGGDENNQPFTINYTVTDDDGDSAPGTLSINVDDDSPVLDNVVAGGDVTLDESNFPFPVSDNSGVPVIDFTALFGADGAAAVDSQVFGLAITGGPGSGIQTAVGDFPITLVLIDGDTIEGHYNGSNVAFIIQMEADGTVTLTQNVPLEHVIDGPPGPAHNDSLDLGGLIAATVTITDGDGDQATASVGIGDALVFLDDGPTANEGQVTGTVDEDGVVEGIADGGEGDGIAGGTGDVPGAATVASGSVAALFNAGADAPLSFGFAANAVATLQLLGLTSNGLALSYGVNGDTITASTDAGDVFTFQLESDGSWTFTLIDQLDHETGSDENDLLINLGNIVQATDSDGDFVIGAADGLVITVNDDTPTVSEEQVTGTVDEDGVLEGAADGGEGDGILGGTGDVPFAATVASGTVDAMFHSGADAPLSYAFAADAIATLAALNLESNGIALDYAINGDTITASTAAGDVFTFELTADGSWTFTLIDQLDHAADDDENDLTINLGNIIEATDADGDSVVGAADGLVITVDDDTPVARPDEDTVPAGGDIITGNVITGADTDTGIGGRDSTGADAPAVVTGLASNNVDGNIDNDPAGGGYIVAGEFGQLTLQPDGSYSYDRFGGSPGDVEDVFTYTYTDADGDSVETTLTIHINDSAPTLDPPPAAVVDDDDVAGANGIPGGVDDDVPANTSGTLSATGGDPDIDFFFAGTQPLLPLGYFHNLVDPTTMQILQGATVILTITLDNDTGEYTIVQNNPVAHAPLNNAAGDDTENNSPVLNVGFVAIDEDGTGDESNVVNLSITVDDDTPSATIASAVETVSVDETAGIQPDSRDTVDPAVIALFSGVGTKGTDSDMPAPQYGASASALVTSSGSAYGADGAGTTLFSLNVSATGVDSGLDTTAGVSIFLFLENGLVVGRAGADAVAATSGPAAFAVSINPTTGVVSMVQYMSLDHPNPATPDEPVSIADGAILGVVTVTDSDGDSDTSSVGIGDQIQFQDDAPTAAVVSTVETVSVDETAGIQVDSDDTTNAGVIALFAGVSNKGTDAGMPVPQYGASGSGLVAATGSAYGADGAGTTVFSLNVSVAGVDSGLDTTAGTSIFLFKEGALIVGRVGDASGPAAFAVAIDPTTGVVSMVEYMSINHPNPATPDESVSITDGAILAVATVTDGDGDSATNSVGIGDQIQFQDDAPVITDVTDPLEIANEGTAPTGTGNFAFDVGADDNADFDDISVSNFRLNINNSPAQNVLLFANQDAGGNAAAETATNAYYRFTFEYDTGINGTAQGEGTLVFDKTTGEYTVTLTSGPIHGIDVSSISSGLPPIGYDDGTDTLMPSNPDVSVVELDNGMFVQFSGYMEQGSGTGAFNFKTSTDNNLSVGDDENFSDGEILVQLRDYVTISGLGGNGVHGDTMNKGDILDWDLFNSNPTGHTDLEPTGTAQSMFLWLDGIGTNEDMIVILKLYDTATDTFTTRAVYVGNEDIFKNSSTNAGQYQAIIDTALFDNNDGLVVFEQNDYNTLAQPDRYVIVGAQLATTDEGISGSAINLNGNVGDTGGTTGANTNFAADVNDTGFKIKDIGFVTISTEDQQATIEFDVTVTDGDGDSVTQTDVTVNIGGTSTLLAASSISSSEEEQLQKSAANANTLTLATAVAAAGFVEPVAAHDNGHHNGNDQNSDLSFAAAEVVERYSVSDDGGDAAVSMLAPDASTEASAPADTSSSSSSDNSPASYSLDDSAAQAAPESNDAPAADDGGANSSADAVGPVAPTVAMVSAEALEAAANDNGNAQQGGSVEQIVADALGQGNASATVDALLNALPGGNGAVGALANVASPAASSVPGGDMLGLGAFAPGHDMMFNVHAAMQHHDAVQPVANG